MNPQTHTIMLPSISHQIPKCNLYTKVKAINTKDTLYKIKTTLQSKRLVKKMN